MSEQRIIELPPSCLWCGEFGYDKEAEEIYECKVQYFKSNDVFELWEECPYLHLKYAVQELKEEGE